MTDSQTPEDQAGSSDAFEAIVTFGREIPGRCYRTLWSFHHAAALVEDALESARQALDRPTQAFALRDRPATAFATRSPFAKAVRCSDPWWIEPFPDALIDETRCCPEARYDFHESMTLAFVAGLQHLPAEQRAALVLRDVLGFSIAETAEMLDTTPALVDITLQLARARFDAISGRDEIRLQPSEKECTVVGRFIDAFERGDLEAVVLLLADDAKVAMPPEPIELRGRAVIADFYRSLGFWGQPLRVVQTHANHQPAFGYYLPDPSTDLYRFGGILVLAVTDNQISAITRFCDRGLLARFGLPRTLPRS